MTEGERLGPTHGGLSSGGCHCEFTTVNVAISGLQTRKKKASLKARTTKD
jgi:hypothetical protein